MTTIDLMMNRVSIRKFNDEPIKETVMDDIISAAIQAPTAGNMMIYSIIKIKDKETLKKLSESCDHQPFIASADTALIFVVDVYKWHRYFLVNDVEGYAKRTNRQYQGPTIGDAVLGINDAFCAAQNAVIAAEHFGIGSCYIGDIMENVEYHKELLNLPEYVFPAAMLVFGHYDHRPKARSRFDQKFVVFDERYKTLSDDEIQTMFEKRDEFYNPEISPDIKNFAQQFYNRKIGSDFFKEMNRSLDIIFKMFERP
jgi:nitroreductase